MGEVGAAGAGAGSVGGVGGAEGAGDGVGVVHIPGTSFRVLPDGSVARFITSPGSLLDYAVRLQGAVGETRRILDHRAEFIDFDDPQELIDVLDRWGV